MARPIGKAETHAEEPAVQQQAHELDPTPADELRLPIQEFRLGQIKAAVWENETQLGVRYSVTFTRLYKVEGDPSWRTSTAFNRDDLPLVAKVADLAHTYIFGLVQNETPF